MIKTIIVSNKTTVWYMFSYDIIYQLILSNVGLFIFIYLPEVIKFSWITFLFFQIITIATVFRHPISGRKVYRLDFNYEARKIIFYYYYPRRGRISILYEDFSYKWVTEKAWFFESEKAPQIEFCKKNYPKLILPVENRIGWTKEEIDNIVEELDKVIATQDENMLTR